MVSHKLAMVCREYDDRILKRAGLFEGIKYLANALVNKIDHRVSIAYPLVALMRTEHAGLILLAGAVAVRQQTQTLKYLFIHELRDLIRALSALFLILFGHIRQRVEKPCPVPDAVLMIMIMPGSCVQIVILVHWHFHRNILVAQRGLKRRVERMMRVGEARREEERLVVIRVLGYIRRCALTDKHGIMQVLRHSRHGAGVEALHGLCYRPFVLSAVLMIPFAVVGQRLRRMAGGELHMLKAPVRAVPVYIIALLFPETVILHADMRGVLSAVGALEVQLSDAAGVIAVIMQVVGERPERVLKLVPVCPLVVVMRVQPGKDGHSAWHTDGVVHIAMIKNRAVRRKAVDVWRIDILIAVAAQKILSELVAHDKDQILFLHSQFSPLVHLSFFL